MSQPKTQELLIRFEAFWKVNSFKVKLISAVVGIVVLILIAVQVGQNIAALNRPDDATPAALPTVAPSGQMVKESVFEGLRQQVIDYSPLLPDPAPPAVDANITLKAPER